MILEELTGNAVLTITRNGKAVTIKIGDSFTDEEYQTRTIYGDSGKATIRIDANCTIEIGAQPAPVAETPAPKVKVLPEPIVAPVETPSE
jgi:hypothetical protein